MRRARQGQRQILSFSTANAGIYGANVLLALQSVSGAIQFLGIGVQKGESGLETLKEPWLSST